jgi:proliferating cell nuclear antigen PCNA
MFLTINDKQKLTIFSTIFQMLKSWNPIITLTFSEEKIRIQSMDLSHICLTNIEFNKEWFSTYNCNNDFDISLNTSDFATLMKYATNYSTLELKCDGAESDTLYVNFLINPENKIPGTYNHFFELNLSITDVENINIPNIEYDVEITMETKHLSHVLAELNTFGDTLNIECCEEYVELKTDGENTKLNVNIPSSDFIEYAINEGEVISSSFSLKHFYSKCMSCDLSKRLQLNVSANMPIMLRYDIGHTSFANFYVAPKIAE